MCIRDRDIPFTKRRVGDHPVILICDKSTASVQHQRTAQLFFHFRFGKIQLIDYGGPAHISQIDALYHIRSVSYTHLFMNTVIQRYYYREWLFGCQEKIGRLYTKFFR